jgi:hypothetical protein
MTINDSLAFIRRLRRRVFATSRPSLTPLENFVADAVIAALPRSDADVFRTQLCRLDLIQRSPGGRITAIFLERPEGLPVLYRLEPEHCLADLVLDAGGHELRSMVFSHRGYISSIEFRRNPGSVGSPLSLKTLKLHCDTESMATVVDRAEHGAHLD